MSCILFRLCRSHFNGSCVDQRNILNINIAVQHRPRPLLLLLQLLCCDSIENFHANTTIRTTKFILLPFSEYNWKTRNVEHICYALFVTLSLLLSLPTNADAPSCAPNQPRVYGVAKQEQAQIKCTVDANPSDVEFKWTFNNSAESIDVASNHVTRSGKYYYYYYHYCCCIYFHLGPLYL